MSQQVPIGKPCAACGDPATRGLQGKFYCHECWLELAKGKISTRPARYYRIPGTSTQTTHEDRED